MHFGVNDLAVVFHAQLEADKAISRANVAYTADDFAFWLPNAPELSVTARRVVIHHAGDERLAGRYMGLSKLTKYKQKW